MESIHELWIAQTGRPVQTIREDLDYLFAKLFNPRTSGARLRSLLETLPHAPLVRSRHLNPPLVIRTEHALIVTPEGRAIYGLLNGLLSESDDDPIGIDLIDALSLLNLVYQGYREVGVKRLEDAVQLLKGDAEGLRLPSIGLLLLLLVNGSTTPESAIRRPRDSEELDRLDSAVARAISAFADTLSSGKRDSGHFSLYSGYVVTEARRRLGNALGPSPDEIYVSRPHRDAVIQRIVRELRRTRRSPETAQVMTAFDNLVLAYRAERPTLASLGLTHESRADTAQLRTQLENALGAP